MTRRDPPIDSLQTDAESIDRSAFVDLRDIHRSAAKKGKQKSVLFARETNYVVD